jgi:hypothetical protein
MWNVYHFLPEAVGDSCAPSFTFSVILPHVVPSWTASHRHGRCAFFSKRFIFPRGENALETVAPRLHY